MAKSTRVTCSTTCLISHLQLCTPTRSLSKQHNMWTHYAMHKCLIITPITTEKPGATLDSTTVRWLGCLLRKRSTSIPVCRHRSEHPRATSAPVRCCPS
eukprot:6461095-Amphidinium_carterae.1